uniref:Retrovirus-related Pol polyprotein from transposon 17.6 n=1 Tax=Arachis duranensis TaxID=130453 RepID=N1NFZ5_ARADU|nr:hypothetical protein ARAX_ADH179B13-002 [Arachis duranensis]
MENGGCEWIIPTSTKLAPKIHTLFLVLTPWLTQLQEMNLALLTDLSEMFSTIKKHEMRLNPLKCNFAVEAEKFLGFMLTQSGIETNPDKCTAIQEMKSLTCLKKVQELNERLVALSRFLTGSTLKSLPFFSILKKGTNLNGLRNVNKSSKTSKHS